MLILKDEDLSEACSYFLHCYRQFENYQAYMKIYVTEKVKQVLTSAIVKLPEGNSRPSENLYKKLTAAPSPNAVAATVTLTCDEKLDTMKVKITKEFNSKEVQAEVIDKSSIKCACCQMVVKLRKPYNIHNFKKHRERCQKMDSAGTQSIATLFMAMTAVAQRVKSKAETMIAECQNLKDNGLSIDNLLETLQKVAEKPSCLDSVTGEIKRFCLEAVETRRHPLFISFTELCDAGKVTIESESSDDDGGSSGRDDESEEGSVL